MKFYMQGLMLLMLLFVAMMSCKTDETVKDNTKVTSSRTREIVGDDNDHIDVAITTLVNEMLNFRKSLSNQLLADASFSLEDEEFYSWSNLPPSQSERGGISFGELSEKQLELFYELLSVFLSDDGYNKVSLITKDVETLISNFRPGFGDPNAYHIALFGDPEADDSWGFQLDGHHLALNFLVDGDEVTFVPAFIGSEPATINDTEVLGDERDHAFTLFKSLPAIQREVAIQTGDRKLQVGPGDSTDPYLNYDYAEFEGIGLKASEMNNTQKEHLRNLIKTYVYNLDTAFADVWMTDIDASLDDTYFVWIGSTSTDDPIYYRVFNPAIWIEYNNEERVGPGGLDRPGPPDGQVPPDGQRPPNGQRPPDRQGPPDGQVPPDGPGEFIINHVHTITRSPNGKDYGIFALNRGPKTLLEHYTMADHHIVNDELFDYTIVGQQNGKYPEVH